MKERLLLAGAIGYSLSIAAIVVILAGYYETMSILVMQMLFIAGPTLVPILLAWRLRGHTWLFWPIAFLLPLTGWAGTIWIDTRPYIGGGASFAILTGWFACSAASVIIAIVVAIRRAMNQSIPKIWRNPPQGVTDKS